MHGMYQ